MMGSFSAEDLSLINNTARAQVSFIESLELPSGAIVESPNSNIVYTRDLALAAFGLSLSNRFAAARKAVNYVLSLEQSSSHYAGPGGTSYYSSPPAWDQVYNSSGGTIDPSRRGEDQGMVLLAASTYAQKAHDLSLVESHWKQIENSANFILYLQHTPEPGFSFNGLYRHGDNYMDARRENMNGSTPLYWPYWPEYYQWEEENMRMIMGLRGAIQLASNLGFYSDAQKWNSSVTLALSGLKNESASYGRYEVYDYFGSVLWGIQTNVTAEKSLLEAVPTSFLTAFGLKDLPWSNTIGSSDTVDYIVCLVRTGEYAAAGPFLGALIARFQNPSGGFYDTISMYGRPDGSSSTVYSSARFLYLAYVVSTATQGGA
jgi:hypothetical protein